MTNDKRHWGVGTVGAYLAVRLSETASGTGERGVASLDTSGRILVALPLTILVVMVWSWLAYAIDFPLYDDWRAYMPGQMDVFSLRYLFLPANDTLYPVGKLLDYFAFIVWKGNSIPYQTASMTIVLGALLLLQWRLLVRVLGDRLAAAACFTLTVFMLQPGSYWGLQNLAYHQALPLLCLLGIIDLATSDSVRARTASPAAFALGIFGGLTYISGAFGALISGLSLLVISHRLQEGQQGNTRAVAWSTLIAGLLTTIPQLWVIVFYQKGVHRSDAPMAYPFEFDFWMFALGNVGRSLMLPTSTPVLSLTLVLIVLIALGLLTWWCIAPLVKREAVSGARLQVGTVLVVLGSAVFVYLMLVAAGRANLRPALVDTGLAIFQHGTQRFHFFWLTLIWPWLCAALVVWMWEWRQGAGAYSRRLFVGAALAIFACAFAGGVYHHGSAFRATNDLRARQIACIAREQATQTPRTCVPFFPTVAVRNAVRMKASFARILQNIEPDPASGRTVFWLTAARDQQVVAINAQMTLTPDRRIVISPARDAIVVLKIDPASGMDKCNWLHLKASIVAKNNDVAKLFYRRRGDKNYSTDRIIRAPYNNVALPATVSFEVKSDNGFESEVRLAPGVGEQRMEIHQLEIRCHEHARFTLFSPLPTP